MSSHIEPVKDRFKIDNEGELRTVIHRRGGLEPIEVELVDVSINGIRLRVPVNLQFEESITVHILARKVNLDIEVAAFVKWLRPTEMEDWFVGCRVQPDFSEEALTHLASMGCIERRGSPRREVQLSASICGETE